MDQEQFEKFFKWGCKYAEGFQFYYDNVSKVSSLHAPNAPYVLKYLYEDYVTQFVSEIKNLLLPLFCFEIIEGINQSFKSGCILSNTGHHCTVSFMMHDHSLEYYRGSNEFATDFRLRFLLDIMEKGVLK